MRFLLPQASKEAGFTLVELMIVIAIIGVLASVAIPSYNSYIGTAKTAVVVDNESQLISFIRNSYVSEQSRVAIGLPADASTLPTNEVALIAYLNRKLNAKSPTGEDAYASTADATKGVIGVTLNMNDSSWYRDDSIEVSRPAYRELSAKSKSVTYN